MLHGSAFEKSFSYCLEAGRKIGRNFNAAKEFKKWLTETGFVEVAEKQYFSPVNGWPVDRQDQLIGHWCKYSDRFPSLTLKSKAPAPTSSQNPRHQTLAIAKRIMPRATYLFLTDCLNLLRFSGSITKMLESGGMPLEDIPGFQEQMRYDITSSAMRVYHPRESCKVPLLT